MATRSAGPVHVCSRELDQPAPDGGRPGEHADPGRGGQASEPATCDAVADRLREDLKAVRSARLELAATGLASGLPGPARRRADAELLDAALRRLWESADPATDQVALAAVGSLGRRDGGPASDLDLVLLHDGTLPAEQVTALADRLWYPIWDAGLDLDHSVRSLAGCRQVAAANLPAALGMLDLRRIAGSPDLVTRAGEALLADWRSAARKRLSDLIADVRNRADKRGELAYLIEPDLKETRGGLRDAIVMFALAASWLTDRPHGEVDRAYEFLLQVRDVLQLTAGRGVNRLLLAYQDEVGAALGLDADELLAELAQAARTISYGLDVTVRQARGALKRPGLSRPVMVRGRRTGPRLRQVAQGLVEHDGELVLSADADPTSDSLLPLRAAATAARSQLALSPVTVGHLASSPRLPAPWPEPAREYLQRLLASGASQVPIWEALDLAGVVATWIPGWDVIRNRPQRNPLHRHTVDRHLIETVVVACRSLPQVADGPTLLLSALLHDIGKRPGGSDHAAVGAELVPGIGAHLGLSPQLTGDIQLLVRHHLLLAELATTRDLSELDAAHELIAAMGERADLVATLRELTAADSQSIGHKAWTSWRAALVDTLTGQALALLGSAPTC